MSTLYSKPEDDKGFEEIESEIKSILEKEVEFNFDDPYPSDPESPYLPKEE